MPGKVLLISANQCATPEPVFPLGLAYVSTALRDAGYECIWLDPLATDHDVVELVSKNRPDFIGISLRNIDDVLIKKKETFFDGLATLVATIRGECACPIILGGSGFSIFPAPLMELSGAEYGVVGEGETAIVTLLGALENGEDYRRIPGLVYRQQDAIVVNPRGPAGPALKILELDRPSTIIAHYLRTGGGLNLQTQRGCAHRCGYCTYPLIEGKNLRCRSPEAVAAEFEQLYRTGARYVFLVDSVFNSSARHVAEVCEALVKLNLKLPWGCFLRPQGLTSELMRLMACAGMTHVEFGSDSFCDGVLSTYGKDFTFDDVLFSSELARREKVDCCHFLIAGGPGETAETLACTFKNSRLLSSAVFMAVVGMRIYPGTSLFEQAVREGQIDRHSNLLFPAYYLAPGLKMDEVFARLTEFSRACPNWIVGDADPAYQDLVARLRQRGVAGPLWGFFSMIQRIKPQELGIRSVASSE
jgi:radical SAM superfamily enzyme YgiQ (UPF0313 family)